MASDHDDPKNDYNAVVRLKDRTTALFFLEVISMKEKKNNITELVFIIDRSGSMFKLVNDTIGGFNSMIEKQKKQDGECYVSTVLFYFLSLKR